MFHCKFLMLKVKVQVILVKEIFLYFNKNMKKT